ncbi:MAG: manganese efflux pump [Clostridia bacterium]|nr:manganese efflux pump [Clostridia bacterium]
MDWSFMFFLESILLGCGLAMDAFSVSLANGLNEKNMRNRKMIGIAGVFAFFQGLMPMIGWICVHTVLQHFQAFEKFIPWIALALLGFIGGKMLIDGIRHKEECESVKLTIGGLLLQGVATSIDALSVGFTIAEYPWQMALVSVLIIGIVTFIICMLGIFLGKVFGTRLADKATIIGGIILILIGIEIFVTGLLGL